MFLLSLVFFFEVLGTGSTNTSQVKGRELCYLFQQWGDWAILLIKIAWFILSKIIRRTIIWKQQEKIINPSLKLANLELGRLKRFKHKYHNNPSTMECQLSFIFLTFLIFSHSCLLSFCQDQEQLPYSLQWEVLIPFSCQTRRNTREIP